MGVARLEWPYPWTLTQPQETGLRRAFRLEHDVNAADAHDIERHHRVYEAVRQAAYDCGLPAHLFAFDYDLAKTGKLLEVVHHAAIILGVEHGLHTVDQVVDVLVKSLEK